MDKQQATQKIAKLMKHAQSASDIGSDAEAMSFMKMATKLMAEYQLSELDIADREKKEIKIISRRVSPTEWGMPVTKRKSFWQTHIAAAIGNITNTSVLMMKKTNALLVFGTEENINLLIHYMGILVPMANKLAKAEYEEYSYYFGKDNKFQRSWKMGFADGLRSAILEEQEQFSEETAMVLVSHRKEVEAKALARSTGVSRTQASTSKAAYESGHERGRQAKNFNKGLE